MEGGTGTVVLLLEQAQRVWEVQLVVQAQHVQYRGWEAQGGEQCIYGWQRGSESQPRW